MKRFLLMAGLLALSCACNTLAQPSFTLEQVMSAPFADNLVAAKSGNRIAWTLNQNGRRNIWVAPAASFDARQATAYDEDDGGELSDLHFTADSNAIVCARGEGRNASGEYANPTSNPAGVQETVFPDEVHDFLLQGSWVKAYQATSDFFDRQFGIGQK